MTNCFEPGPFPDTKCWKQKGHKGEHADAGFGYHLSWPAEEPGNLGGDA